MRRNQITVAEQIEALNAALSKNAKGRKAGDKLAGHPHVQAFVAKRQFKKYLDAGGDATNWQAFFDWLLKNLPAIIAMIMTLFA